MCLIGKHTVKASNHIWAPNDLNDPNKIKMYSICIWMYKRTCDPDDVRCAAEGFLAAHLVQPLGARLPVVSARVGVHAQ